MRPISLRLFPREGAQSQIGFGLRTRAMPGDAMAKMIGAAAVAAFTHHLVEPAGGEVWELLQRLENKRHVRIELRGSLTPAKARQTGLRQHSGDGAVMYTELPGDGAGAPLLDAVIAQDLSLELSGNRHGSAPLRRRRKSLRTNGEQGRPHQWQRHGDSGRKQGGDR